MDLNLQLQKEANVGPLPESRRYVSLLIDEMKIKEDLIYDKHSGHIIGLHIWVTSMMLFVKWKLNVKRMTPSTPLYQKISWF